MLTAFLAVLHDLWQFITRRERAVEMSGVWPVQTLAAPLAVETLAPRPVQLALAPAEVTPIPVVPVEKLSATPTSTTLMSGTLLYVEARDGVALLATPHLAFDTSLRMLAFGQAVTLKRFHDRYAEVLVRGQVGFIPKDALTESVERVQPRLHTGTIYEATHEATSAIRLLLEDTFLAGALALPLQAGEYVLYRLMRDHVTIPWPSVRPRMPGQWHTLLRGQIGVHSGVAPKTDSVMEWLAEDGDGRLAYVDAVLPDQTLRLSGVGIAVAGEYSELTVPASLWREWRPVFITITP
jgi:hypothetical protein